MKILRKAEKYNFELRHISLLFMMIIVFEVVVFFVIKDSLGAFLNNTQDWYRRYSSDRIANSTANSFEMLIETIRLDAEVTANERKKMIQKFDVLMNQQLVEDDIIEVCLFFYYNKEFFIIDDGEVLFENFIERSGNISPPMNEYGKAKSFFNLVKNEILTNEIPKTVVDSNQVFHSFIPFVPEGEFSGIIYIQSKPNFSELEGEFLANYDLMSFSLSILILLGLLVVYNISSRIVKQKNKTQEELYEQKQKLLEERIKHEKEFIFTKRIYHANHKSERIMGFIQEDLAKVEGNDELSERISKYTSFISRVVYDMKWYEPPINTIRNPYYRTNVNDVIRFLVDHVFQRLTVETEAIKFKVELDPNFPVIGINEFVIWEILEPLIQNSLSHNSERNIEITITTEHNVAAGKSIIWVQDNGVGIKSDLLEKDADGVKMIFHENIKRENEFGDHFGYGCFIAYNMAVKGCGWKIDVENLSQGGCRFILELN